MNLEFDSEGAEKFGKLTTDQLLGEPLMAIVLDGEIQTAPRIEEPITGGRCSISGGAMDIEEAITDGQRAGKPAGNPGAY